MKIRTWLGFVCMAALAAACGDDEEDTPAAQPATVNQQLAQQNARGTIAALVATQSSSTTNAGLTSAASLASVAQSSQNLLQAQPGAAAQSVAAALTIEGGVRPLDLGGEGCSCTGTSCTFTGCSSSASSGAGQYSFTVDGSYSWGGGHIECKNLKYTFDGSNLGGVGGAIGVSTKVVVTLNCDMTLTSTSIDGYIQSAGSTSTEVAGENTQAAYSTSWDVKTTYSGVTFDGSHMPTAGTLRVEGTTSVTAAGQVQTFAGSAEVTFP